MGALEAARSGGVGGTRPRCGVTRTKTGHKPKTTPNNNMDLQCTLLRWRVLHFWQPKTQRGPHPHPHTPHEWEPSKPLTQAVWVGRARAVEISRKTKRKPKTASAKRRKPSIPTPKMTRQIHTA